MLAVGADHDPVIGDVQMEPLHTDYTPDVVSAGQGNLIKRFSGAAARRGGG